MSASSRTGVVSSPSFNMADPMLSPLRPFDAASRRPRISVTASSDFPPFVVTRKRLTGLPPPPPVEPPAVHPPLPAPKNLLPPPPLRRVFIPVDLDNRGARATPRPRPRRPPHRRNPKY